MKNNWKAEVRRGLLLCLGIFGLAAALFILPSQFSSSAGGKQVRVGLFQQTKSHEEGLDNYDIRDDAKNEAAMGAFAKYRERIGKDSAVVADLRADFVRGEEQFKSRFPNAKVEYNHDIRTPEVMTPDVFKNRMEWLSQPSAMKRSDILRNFVKENNSLIGVSDAQADALKVTADYTNPNGYTSFAHLEQFINDIPVFRGEVKAGFTKDGQIIRVINNLAPGLDYESLSTDFRDPSDAVKAAFSHINRVPQNVDLQFNEAASNSLKTVFGEGDWATTAEKMYFPTEPGVAVPSWRVTIWLPINAYMVIVDTEGRLLWRKNATNDQTESGTYQIYRNANAFIGAHDSPAPLSPGPTGPINTAGTLIPNRTNVTLIGNEAPYTFNNNGWMTNGTNITDGNNVEAGIDRVTPNGVDAPLTGDTGCPGAGCRTFTSTWNPPPGNPAPGDDPLTTQAQRGAVIQMWYVVNRWHDEMYRVGFTEAARNFQNDNYGRGGAGNDRISAEGQDSGGFNNANFSIVSDGTRGRMQMFLWNGPTPDYDGTADAEVIIHEVSHGTSQRLHGNAAGLTANMSGGMGEGWGDWYAYTMLAEPSDPINGIYTTGGYATFNLGGMQSSYYHGIRRFPRAPITFTGGPNNLPHNPFTFKHLNGNCDTTLGTTTTAVSSAFPRNPAVSTSSGVQACNQVHNGGEVWSSMLWEVRNRFVTRLGFSAGTTRVLQVVTDGMKLSPLNPTFLQARDAIIAAAAALPGTEASADVFDVREGFRVRGMGFSASIQNANTGGTANATAVTEAFDVPNAIFVNPISVSDATGDNDGFPEPTETITISVPITNNSGGGVINNVTASITGGGTANYGNIADGQTVVRNITYTVPAGAACGSIHTVNITGSSDLGALNPRQHSFQLGAPVGGAPVTFTSSTPFRIPGGTATIGNADVYPTTINVSGLTGGKKIKLELTNLSTTYPGDMDLLLVGPGGQKFVVMSDAVSAFSTQASAVVTFSDEAAATLPAGSLANMAGSWKPTDHNVTPADAWGAPAPASPYSSPAPTGSATFASVFGTSGANMNGAWSLYGVDDTNGDFATLAGWKLTFEANDFVCQVTPPNAVESRADFDGDGRTDLSVFRPSEGNWYLNQSTAGFGVVNWGVSSDVLTPGDFDGDGKADLAVFRANADATQPDFYILNSQGFTVTGVSWGLSGDVPVIRDYDGDDKEDIAVYRPSNNTWYILKSGGGATYQQYGVPGDIPVGGDFVGDSKADIAMFRPSTNTWWIYNGSGDTVIPFGQTGDILVPADYNGDDKDDLAVFRPSTGQWIYQPSGGGEAVFVTWGTAGDVPAPGDYDGDGKDDQAIYRNGQWWVNRSTGGVTVANFGLASDKALPRSYVP